MNSQCTVRVRELPVPVYGAPYGSQPLRLSAPTVQTGTVVPYPLKVRLLSMFSHRTRSGNVAPVPCGLR